STENIAVLLDVSGEQPQYVWPEKRFVYSAGNEGKARLSSFPLLDNEYFLTFWSDYRTSSLTVGAAAFAQKVFISDDHTAVHFPETGSDNRFEVVSNGKNGKVDFVVDSPEAGNATLEIYSVSGQKVARIQSKLHSGKNTIPWNVQRLSTGVYLVRLATQNGVQTKRFIV
ncbi:MAG: T9SS type A sorting domain-containing protein, partial [Candidatus Symbiothrix sp.]|nr:T9SS type A sorting domain-containing protein [Candidatus Symbiothrix sp.]